MNQKNFPNIALVTRRFLAIPGSQIKFKRIFGTYGIMTGLHRIYLEIYNCSNLIFININYPDDKEVPINFTSDEEEALLDLELYLESLHHEVEYHIMRDIIRGRTDKTRNLKKCRN